jgi:hypothetical protein
MDLPHALHRRGKPKAIELRERTAEPLAANRW